MELHYVTPREWKRHFNLGPDKEQARALAIRLYPKLRGLHLKKHQGRAEALLLGRYFLGTNRRNDNGIKGETTVSEYLYLATLVGFAAILMGQHFRITASRTDLDMLERHVGIMTARYDQIGMEAITQEDEHER